MTVEPAPEFRRDTLTDPDWSEEDDLEWSAEDQNTFHVLFLMLFAFFGRDWRIPRIAFELTLVLEEEATRDMWCQVQTLSDIDNWLKARWGES
jgi:hypothetical protein